MGHICPDGYCDIENRTIHILIIDEDHQWMLVHLICHAVTDNNHWIYLQERMKSAELQALQSSMIRLADALKEDLNRYLNLGEVTAKEVEQKSFETAIELPESSPEIWLEVVSSSYEMTGEPN